MNHTYTCIHLHAGHPWHLSSSCQWRWRWRACVVVCYGGCCTYTTYIITAFHRAASHTGVLFKPSKRLLLTQGCVRTEAGKSSTSNTPLFVIFPPHPPTPTHRLCSTAAATIPLHSWSRLPKPTFTFPNLPRPLPSSPCAMHSFWTPPGIPALP